MGPKVLNHVFWTWVFLSFSSANTAFADQLLGNWQRGDLIFQETRGFEAEMLKTATGSRLTHVGILRASGGGPIVIEATPDGDVYETDLDVFLQRGVGHDYEIYRIKDLTPPKDWYHPIVLAATDYFNWEYDLYYRKGDSEIYSSELVYLSAKKVGVELGGYERLGDLNVDNEVSRSFFLDHWKQHPDCRELGADRDSCWSIIKDQLVVTPASLARSQKLELVVSTFSKN
jgi:hypothetical protein